LGLLGFEGGRETIAKEDRVGLAEAEDEGSSGLMEGRENDADDGRLAAGDADAASCDGEDRRRDAGWVDFEPGLLS
jgi:hypothetical protein